MDKVIKSKRDVELVTCHSSGYNTIPEKIPVLIKFDDIIESDFWINPKITSENLCKPVHDMIKYSTSIYPFVSGKCGKEGKKHKKWISWERKGLFRWNRKHFS